MSIDISIRGLEKTRRILQHEAYNEDDNNKLFHKLAEDIVAEARHNLQQNTNINTGHLISSIRILHEDIKNIIIGTDVDYAGYIEYGRGPVRPLKEGGWLHWIDKQTGKDVFAKFAKATEPSPFLEPAVIANTKRFQDIYAERVKQRVETA